MSSTNRPEDRGSSPLQEPERKKRPWWLLLLLAVVIVVVLLLLLSRCGGKDSSTSSDASSPTKTASAPASASPESAQATPSTTPVPSASAAPSAGTSSGSLTAGGTNLLPLTASAPSGTLTTYDSKSVRASAVMVLSVPADEGFWVGSSKQDRVWVQISGSGESPYQVKAGDNVDFTGVMTKNAPGFAKNVGVSPAEGAAQLTKEMSHVQVKRGAVTLSR